MKQVNILNQKKISSVKQEQDFVTLTPLLKTKQTNLQKFSNRFIGRKKEQAKLSSLIKTHRLITISGPPGMGKTRLANEFALQCLEQTPSQFQDGIFFCDCTEAKTVLGICSILSQALKIPLSSAHTAKQAVSNLGTALSQWGKILLIFDNFEHLVSLAPDTLNEWYQAATHIRFLITSRERLALPEERILELTPLSLADKDGDTPSESLELFLERARFARPEYTPSEEELSTLHDLLKHLDGIPLAIELAAARMCLMSPTQILNNLHRRFQLLSASDPGTTPKILSLQEAIDWSWNLLDTHEQSVLAQCAVFRDGFTLEAAEAVIQLDEEAPWILDSLQSLHDKSLLSRYQPEGQSNHVRISMYLSIREYGWNKLPLEEKQALKQRHAVHFVNRCTSWQPLLKSPQSIETLKLLQLELENLLHAYHWLLYEAPKQAKFLEQALLIARTLEPLLYQQGPVELRFSLFDEILKSSYASELSFSFLATALIYRARAKNDLGQLEQAFADLEHAKSIVAPLQNQELPALLSRGFMLCLFTAGKLVETKQACEEALAIYQTLEDPWEEGVLTTNLALFEQQLGNFQRSETLYQHALTIHRSLQDTSNESNTLSKLGILKLDQGCLEEARQYFNQAIPLAKQVADLNSEGLCLSNLASLEQEYGEFESAELYQKRALSIFKKMANGLLIAASQTSLGMLYHEMKCFDKAQSSYQNALQNARQSGAKHIESIVLSWKGSLAAEQGHIKEADQCLIKAKDQVAQTKNSFPISEQLLAISLCIFDLALAKDALKKGIFAQAKEKRSAAQIRKRLTLNKKPYESTLSSQNIQKALEVKATLRIFNRMLACLEIPKQKIPSSQKVFQIGKRGRWFQLPEGKRVNIQKRRALCYILETLAHSRLESPGKALSVELLQRKAWPGENLHPDAAKNRVYTALWSLRKLGLQELLQRCEDGYLLDPNTHTLLEESDSP